MKANFFVLLIIGIVFKVLLIPAYYSTDFDVHHNWLRITSNVSLDKWYFDNINKWTLDYPPFFAYFQYFLSLVAEQIDPVINTLSQTKQAFYFQRFSVILWQIPMAYILYLIYNKNVSGELVLAYLFLPFTILDNIHFQYNIMLQCLFLLSFYFLKEKKYLLGAFIYSSLLNFKHIYLYCSLAYFLIILKNYVLIQSKPKKQQIKSLFKVAIITLLPFIISFLPFLATSGIEGLIQILKRLFPFGRGLIHQFWAPNFWALYYFSDKILYTIISKVMPLGPALKINIQQSHAALHELKILPQPSANMTLVIIIFSMIPLIYHFIKHKNVNNCNLVVISGLCFFFFGYHVHEKAITPYIHLLFVIITSQKSNCPEKKLEKQNQKVQNNIFNSQNKYIFCAIFINIINLFPLLIDIKQKPLKLILIIIYILVWKSFSKLCKVQQYLILIGLAIVIICEILPFFLFKRYQFFPLMLNSVFCAIFNLFWLSYFYIDQFKSDVSKQQKQQLLQEEQERKRLIQEQSK